MSLGEFENTIHGMISAIKLVRCFTGLGLKDSKIICERWAKAYHYDFNVQTSDPDEICALGRLAYGVKSGEFKIDDHDNIVVNRPISDEDIRHM